MLLSDLWVLGVWLVWEGEGVVFLLLVLLLVWFGFPLFGLVLVFLFSFLIWGGWLLGFFIVGFWFGVFFSGSRCKEALDCTIQPYRFP